MYDEHLLKGSLAVEPIIEAAAASLGQDISIGQPTLSLYGQVMHALLNSTQNVAIVVFNPTSWIMTKFVEAPCFQTNLVVRDANGDPVPYDILPAINASTGPCLAHWTCGYPNVTAPYTLFFEVSVAALGTQTYFVSVGSSIDADGSSYSVSESTYHVTNGVVGLEFDPLTRLLTRVSNTDIGKSVGVQQNFMQYDESSHVGDGAYVLNPITAAAPVSDVAIEYQVVQGNYVIEVRQKFTIECHDSALLNRSCGVAQVHRIFTSTDHTVSSVVDILTSVGPLALNKDFISRYTTTLETGNEFYSDDNCFDTHTRAYNGSGLCDSWNFSF